MGPYVAAIGIGWILLGICIILLIVMLITALITPRTRKNEKNIEKKKQERRAFLEQNHIAEKETHLFEDEWFQKGTDWLQGISVELVKDGRRAALLTNTGQKQVIGLDEITRVEITEDIRKIGAIGATRKESGMKDYVMDYIVKLHLKDGRILNIPLINKKVEKESEHYLAAVRFGKELKTALGR